MDPLELSARFALAPNSFHYCGKQTFPAAFAKFLKHRTPAARKKLESELKKFKSHYAYLSLIAHANRLAPFSPGISEALWLGSPLLWKVKNRDLKRMILSDFTGPGLLPDKKAREISSRLPDGALPHHSMHPIFIGSATGVIGNSVIEADSCRPSWGTVIRSNRRYALLKSQSLSRKNGKLILIPAIRKARLSCSGITLVPSPKIGDLIATHWDFAIMKLSRKQAKSLAHYTKLNLNAANSRGKRLK